MTSVSIFTVEEHKTQEGSMFPIYRVWDENVGSHIPKMVYATTLKPNSAKTPILHMKRTSLITAVSGHVRLEFVVDGKLKSVLLRTSFPQSQTFMVLIGPEVPIAIYNFSDMETAVVINCCSPSWHPDDQDTTKFAHWSQYFDWKTTQNE